MSSSLFPDFPHSIDSEPTEDWTVENVLQWYLLQSHMATDQKHAELVASLQQQMEEGKRELLNAISEPQNENVAPANNKNGMAAMAGDQSKGTAAYSTLSTKQPSTAALGNSLGKVEVIQVQITTGPHAGKTFSLQPKPNAPCLVGRSAGKKFREKGVSLSKDSEVSTTHGKFEIIAGKAYFTDVGSTNGTVCKDRALATNEAFLLEDSLELILGGSTLRISFTCA